MELITKENQIKLQELRKSGRYCCINISSDYHYIWYLELIKSEGDKHEPCFQSGAHEDLNDAVKGAFEFDKDSTKP